MRRHYTAVALIGDLVERLRRIEATNDRADARADSLIAANERLRELLADETERLTAAREDGELHRAALAACDCRYKNGPQSRCGNCLACRELDLVAANRKLLDKVSELSRDAGSTEKFKGGFPVGSRIEIVLRGTGEAK